MLDLTESQKILAKAECLYDRIAIDNAINNIAQEMNHKLKDLAPIFLCVMNGALIFMGQLLVKLNFNLQLDYIHVSRYRGEMHSSNMHWFAKPSVTLKDRNIVIVEDILDSGLTIAGISDYCSQEGAKSIFTCALIDKDCERDSDGIKTVDFAGLKIENKFLIGFGLDYQGFFRNLPGIYAVNK